MTEDAVRVEAVRVAAEAEAVKAEVVKVVKVVEATVVKMGAVGRGAAARAAAARAAARAAAAMAAAARATAALPSRTASLLFRRTHSHTPPTDVNGGHLATHADRESREGGARAPRARALTRALSEALGAPLRCD